MTITIVCGCGHHNLVFDTDLEKARCESCNTLLLKPVSSLVKASEAQRKTA